MICVPTFLREKITCKLIKEIVVERIFDRYRIFQHQNYGNWLICEIYKLIQKSMIS